MSEPLETILILLLASGLILLGAFLTADPFGGEGEE